MTAFIRAAVLTACLGSCAAPAMAAQHAPRVAVFRAEVKGVQTTTWTENHTPQSRCDQSVTGSGRERVVFHSTRPQKMIATLFGGHHVLFGSADLASADIVTRATVDRQGATSATPLAPTCLGAGGGGGVPPKHDCGTHHGSLAVGLGWSPAGRYEGILLEQGDLGSLLNTYTNCPVIGTAFPELLDLNTSGSPVVARMPVAALFDTTIGKHIVIATGRRVDHSGDSSSTTNIRFTVSLTRVKGGR
jgi:hypothetical protein